MATFAVRLLVEVFDRELEVVRRDLVAGDRLHRLVAASAAADEGHDGEGDHRGGHDRTDDEQASHSAASCRSRPIRCCGGLLPTGT
jgi:hypothetical protein